MTKISLSFDDGEKEIPIDDGGTPANAFNPFGYGTPGRIIGKSSDDDGLYLFEFDDKNRPNEYIWRANLYPVPLENKI